MSTPEGLVPDLLSYTATPSRPPTSTTVTAQACDFDSNVRPIIENGRIIISLLDRILDWALQTPYATELLSSAFLFALPHGHLSSALTSKSNLNSSLVPSALQVESRGADALYILKFCAICRMASGF